ncbi:hypothetical protein MPTK1_8g09970 [Marchantia polymorpha subsp. ruderalis]|uniref:Vesicle-associated membrane protein 72E n=1 Tax=Marchantia polymorpha TaxID=3197 RepID=A0A0H5BGB4_MARPO|nr:hypothetical protein MARPO_0008s0225 [Marchantia polymorpha]PTQ47481.1 hypothetical protein MARPO_0008s0227 [Marchantia polymorpha]BAS01271.1 vesicle-associated membrane protein 72E [Marchantia polymorpha]BBN19354.1 hypothetical protein Mp_8g09970 [Marchantia polymorpha subsp. ruderalis]|eukprot:PTQ47479.1 hypothetical protein MARPO_0008s0225 [Marchantia polymorpha]
MGANLSSKCDSSPDVKNHLIYCFVARGTGPGVVVLAEYKPVEGNFQKIGLDCARMLAANDHSITYICNTVAYTCDHSTTVPSEQHTFNFLVEDEITYLVVAEKDVDQNTSLWFLVRVKDDFQKMFLKRYIAEARAHSLDKRLRPIMKKHMTFCVQDHLKRLDKKAKIGKQLEEVKALCLGNISKLMDRNERVEDLEEKVEILVVETEKFEKVARELSDSLSPSVFFPNPLFEKNTHTLRNKLWRLNKNTLFVLLLILAVVHRLFICHEAKGSGNDPRQRRQKEVVGFLCNNPLKAKTAI